MGCLVLNQVEYVHVRPCFKTKKSVIETMHTVQKLGSKLIMLLKVLQTYK